MRHSTGGSRPGFKRIQIVKKTGRHFAQTEPKMAISREPERSVHRYVSTGSAGNRHLQAGMGGMTTGCQRPVSPERG
jgi:hypothetical protein